MARIFQLVGQGQYEKKIERDRGEQVKKTKQSTLGLFIMSLDKLINCASNAVAVTTHYYCKPVPVCSVAVVDSGPYISTGFGSPKGSWRASRPFPDCWRDKKPNPMVIGETKTVKDAA